MPSNEHGVREITEPVQLFIVGDRMHFTLVSGPCVQAYSISFQKARSAAMVAWVMLRREEGGSIIPLTAIKGGRA